MRKYLAPLLGGLFLPAPEYPIPSAKKSTWTPTNDEEWQGSVSDQCEIASGNMPESEFPAGSADSKSALAAGRTTTMSDSVETYSIGTDP